MQLDWIYYPVTQYSVTGLGLMSSLYLWMSAKIEMRSMRSRMNTSLDTLDSNVRALSSGIDEIRTTQKAVAEPIPVTVAQGLNLTKRTQILRMHRRGESLHSIAAALQLPVGEVSLLLKIDRMTVPETVKAAN